jgi:hypothetical protein
MEDFDYAFPQIITNGVTSAAIKIWKFVSPTVSWQCYNYLKDWIEKCSHILEF